MAFRRLIKSAQQYLERVRNPNPPAEKLLYSFSTPADLALWQTFADGAYGGKSTAKLQLSETEPDTAVLAGWYSRSVGEDSAAVKRSGFCGVRSQVPEGFLELDDYDTLRFRLYGDGRKYIANLRTENWLVGEKSYDVWQAFLFARQGCWQDVDIPMARFLLTWRGRLVDSDVQMNTKRITSLGISLAGGEQLQPEGSFTLKLGHIIAHRNFATF